MADSDQKRAIAEDAILSYLQNHDEIPDSKLFATEANLNHDDITNAIKSLTRHTDVNSKAITKKTCLLTKEGKTYAVHGTPEMQLYLAIPEEGIAKDELQKKFEPSVFNIACAQAAKNR